MIERFTTEASQNYSLLLYPDGDDDLQYIYEKRYWKYSQSTSINSSIALYFMNTELGVVAAREVGLG